MLRLVLRFMQLTFNPHNHIGWENRAILKPTELDDNYRMIIESFGNAAGYTLLQHNDGRFIHLWLIPEQNCDSLAS